MPSSIIQSFPLNATDGYDMITETQKVTAGYFSDGGTSLTPNNIHTGSVADANESYYFDIVQTHPLTSSAVTQFSVAYGHIDGSGSDATMDNANDLYAPTEAIYKQWTNILLAENEITGGFIISNSVSETYDKDNYVLVGKRARFKDRINRKNWSLIFSGSDGAAVGAGLNQLYLTDDSADVKAISTVAGPRYNIVSGSQGTVHTAASARTYGWFYPDQGVMVFSAGALSASIPGTANGISQVASFTKTADNDINPNFHSCSGFAANISNTANPNNALRFVNCLAVAQNTDMVMRFRSEEDQNSTS